jgi:TolB-like protein/tetratricopeptide (TPR) repeat protein
MAEVLQIDPAGNCEVTVRCTVAGEFGRYYGGGSQTLQETQTEENLSEREVRAELERLLHSAPFLQSERLGRFLRFAIENTLAGTTDLLKEYVIGTEVYDRRPPYHPSQDSIVRTEARRLRAKLKEYYESEGKHNPVFIYFRPGTYVPLFRRNETELAPLDDVVVKGAGVAVAVLPFIDLSGRPLSSSCAQGVTEELIHNLTRADGIRVIARQPGGAPEDIPELSQKYGLLTVIEGTVREEYNRLRITARILGSDGFQMSSHRFETEANGEALVMVQEQVATAFVSRAGPALSLVRQRKAAPSALGLAAYPLLMHAESLLDEGNASNLPAALLKFREAASLAPAYARPHCGIAYCNAEMALRGPSLSSALVARGKEAALRAIELDPEMIESHSCLAAAQALEWGWEEAEKSFLHGMSLGWHTSTSRRYGMFLAALGRWDEASHHLESAAQIDPFSNRQKVAWAKFLQLTRRYEDGLRPLSEPLVYGPIPVEARFLQALMAAQAGHKEQARQLVESIRPAPSAELPMMAGVAEVLALNGDGEQAHRIIKSFNLLSLDTVVSRFRQGLLSLALGDGEGAISFLRLALEDREAELVWVGVDPRFDSIRQSAAFAEIAAKVNPHWPL